MKSNFKAMGFGFSAVNAGQRNSVVEPQVVACSTEGSFRITAPVSRVLNVQSGDYMMFINNVDSIDAAIAAKADEVVNFCKENNLELGSTAAAIALHKEFDMWAIAKGVEEYDPKGNKKTAIERLTKADRVKFATANFDSMLEAALADGDEQIKDALSRDGITKDEQIEILATAVQAKEVYKFKGSKLANASGLSGAGVPLNFTDNNVWKQLKADLGDQARKLNRIYDVDIEELQDIVINNGYEDVKVKALILGDYVDKAPSRLGVKKEDDVEE